MGEQEPSSESLEETILTPPPTPVLQGKDRITTTGFVHHEHQGSPPHSVKLNCSYFTETVEQPYTRRLTVGDNKQIGYGWFNEDDLGLDSIGLLIVLNLESTLPPSVQPSKEEIEDTNKRVVKLLINGDVEFDILPGLFFMGHLTDYADVSLRCVHKTASCVIHVFPK